VGGVVKIEPKSRKGRKEKNKQRIRQLDPGTTGRRKKKNRRGYAILKISITCQAWREHTKKTTFCCQEAQARKKKRREGKSGEAGPKALAQKKGNGVGGRDNKACMAINPR